MLRHAIALSALLFTTAAGAQVSGSAALVSDYRFRGISLSHEQPAAQVSVAYDATGGWYAGALAASVKPERDSRAQLLAYLGVVRPLRSNLNWEAGVDYATIAGDTGYAYPEAYLGLSNDHYSGRLYYARHYFGQNWPTLYAMLDRSWRITDHLRVLAHLGLLRRNGAADYAPSHYRVDARAGVAMTWRDFHLQLFWTITRGSDAPRPFPYTADAHPARQRWGISVSRSW